MKYTSWKPLLWMMLLLSGAALAQAPTSHTPYLIWYDRPAQAWEEALPIGNGRLAAMIYGHPQLEEIQLNEETVSAGSPYQNYNPQGKEALKEIRRLIF